MAEKKQLSAGDFDPFDESLLKVATGAAKTEPKPQVEEPPPEPKREPPPEPKKVVELQKPAEKAEARAGESAPAPQPETTRPSPPTAAARGGDYEADIKFKDSQKTVDDFEDAVVKLSRALQTKVKAANVGRALVSVFITEIERIVEAAGEHDFQLRYPSTHDRLAKSEFDAEIERVIRSGLRRGRLLPRR